jgi:hypothetical protein
MRRGLVVFLLAVALLAVPRRAAADATAFVGVHHTDAGNRPLVGFAIGAGLVIVGFEFEYMSASEDLAVRAPGLRMGTGNAYVQNPIPISGLQFYGIVGAGVYRERLADFSDTNFTTNLGGGVKVSLAGPFKLRLDYRVLMLHGTPIHETSHRFAAGLTLAF